MAAREKPTHKLRYCRSLVTKCPSFHTQPLYLLPCWDFVIFHLRHSGECRPHPCTWKSKNTFSRHPGVDKIYLWRLTILTLSLCHDSRECFTWTYIVHFTERNPSYAPNVRTHPYICTHICLNLNTFLRNLWTLTTTAATRTSAELLSGYLSKGYLFNDLLAVNGNFSSENNLLTSIIPPGLDHDLF